MRPCYDPNYTTAKTGQGSLPLPLLPPPTEKEKEKRGERQKQRRRQPQRPLLLCGRGDVHAGKYLFQSRYVRSIRRPGRLGSSAAAVTAATATVAYVLWSSGPWVRVLPLLGSRFRPGGRVCHRRSSGRRSGCRGEGVRLAVVCLWLGPGALAHGVHRRQGQVEQLRQRPQQLSEGIDVQVARSGRGGGRLQDRRPHGYRERADGHGEHGAAADAVERAAAQAQGTPAARGGAGARGRRLIHRLRLGLDCLCLGNHRFGLLLLFRGGTGRGWGTSTGRLCCCCGLLTLARLRCS